MSKALRLYGHLVAANVRAQMQYKLSFAFDSLASFVGAAIEFAGIVVLFRQMDALGNWTLPQIAFLYGTAELALALAQVLAKGTDDLSEWVRRGDFDRVLLRPRGTLFLVLASGFTLRRLGRVVQGALVLGLGLSWLQLDWSVTQWAFLAWTLVGGVVFFTGLFIIGGTWSFWTVEALEVMNVFTYGGVTLVSYPLNIFSEWMRNFFIFIVPLAFVNFYPALYLLGKTDPFGLPDFMPFVAFPLCALVLLVSLGFWRVGVRRYHSTGH